MLFSGISDTTYEATRNGYREADMVKIIARANK